MAAPRPTDSGSAPASRPADRAGSQRPTGGALFRERLTPGPGTWIVLLAFALSFGVVLLPLSLWAAAVVGALAMIAMVGIGIASSPVIEVADGELHAGRARIGVEHLGHVTVLEDEGWTTAMGTGFVPEDHHCTRGWIGSGVRVELTDPEDPTPAWLLSSRRAQDLALALETARRRR